MGKHISLWACLLFACTSALAAPAKFQLEEATIDDIHDAIKGGDVTCKQIVEGYVARAQAYNGICSALVTEDGKPVKSVLGAVRAGKPLQFPTQTVSIKSIVPDFDKYKGKTPDYGRMETTATDPSVYQQYGMLVGLPKAGQVNALETINLRGERSQSCRAECDAASGRLPASCPKECDAFRKQPDALEYAAQLDKKYGRKPDLEAMPLYCVPMSFKAVYDAKDMRSIGGGDVNYAMDAPPEDSTLVARMRKAGAIIYAKAHNSEYNGGSGDPKGDATVEHPMIGRGGSRESWGGLTCNPYDTTRETGGSSGGSGASVSANLVMCSICETTGGSCRNPATLNGVVNLVPMKGTISFGGGIGANPFQDRPGINCRTVKDAATVMDAFRDPEDGFFDARDPYTALPHMTAPEQTYSSALTAPDAKKPLAGMRIGVIREFLVKKVPAQAAISDGINRELKVLRSLGAEVVEAIAPGYPDDPAIPNMTLTFEDAMAEIIPFHMPEILSWKNDDGEPEFSVPGYDVTSRDYLVAASIHKAPWPENLDLIRMLRRPSSVNDPVSGYTFAFNFAQYLMLRGDRRVYDWKTLNENAKYFSDARRAAMKNWENKDIDIRTNAVTHTMKRRYVLRMALAKVLEQNKIDVLVSPSQTTIASKIGGAREPERSSFGYGAAMGIPEVFVPAGFVETGYDPSFVLSADGTEYESKTSTTPKKLAAPLPYNIGFWASPGDELKIVKAASAYEAATHHRKPPAGFGPVK